MSPAAAVAVSVDPFWGRVLICNVDDSIDNVQKVSINLLLAETYEEALVEADVMFLKVKVILQDKVVQCMTVELADCQSSRVHDAIFESAVKHGFEDAVLVGFDEARIISMLNHVPSLYVDSKMEECESQTVAIVDISRHDICGHVLDVKSLTEFTELEYSNIQNCDGVDVEDLEDLILHLISVKNPSTVLINKPDSDAFMNEKDVVEVVLTRLTKNV